MCNSGRSTNARLLPRVTARLCHHGRPAQQVEHQRVPRKNGEKMSVLAHTSIYSSTKLRKHLLVPALFFLNSKMLEDILCSSTTWFQSCEAVVTPLLGWLLLSPCSLCLLSLLWSPLLFQLWSNSQQKKSRNGSVYGIKKQWNITSFFSLMQLLSSCRPSKFDITHLPSYTKTNLVCLN